MKQRMQTLLLATCTEAAPRHSPPSPARCTCIAREAPLTVRVNWMLRHPRARCCCCSTHSRIIDDTISTILPSILAQGDLLLIDSSVLRQKSGASVMIMRAFHTCAFALPLPYTLDDKSNRFRLVFLAL
jgi:hypothetical protein